MTLALLLLLACQEDVYIRRIDKVRYLEATQLCKEAEAKLESEPAASIEKLTRIIQDPAVTEVECNLRIQQSDIYGPPYLFLPYQYRARAKLALAKKTAAVPERKQLVEEAVRDLKFSASRKVTASARLLETAEAELARLARSEPAPAPDVGGPRIRAAWQEQLAARKFRTARLVLEREGAALPESERAGLVAETEQACRAWVTEQMSRFRRNWAAAASIADLQAMTPSEFEVAFALPDPQEVLVAHPSFDWARTHLGALRDARSRKASMARLLAMAEGAARLEEGAENPWFALAEGLAFQDARAVVEKRTVDGADAPRAVREPLLAEARAAVAAWKEFAGRLDPRRYAPAADHLRALEAILDRSPRDLAELDSEDLHACFDGFPVEDRLRAEEEKLRARQSQGGITRESRQKLATLIVAAKSLRLFLEGASDGHVKLAVRDDLERLSRLGGATDPDRFGPRIRKVFDSLR